MYNTYNRLNHQGKVDEKKSDSFSAYNNYGIGQDGKKRADRQQT